MKYSSSMLKRFISLDSSISPEDIANNLILKTVEIEEVIKRELPEKVVIGYVKSCTQHPEADKLSVCVVDCGDKGEFQICCGGANVKEGIFVPTAIPGCYLPAIDLEISGRKLRGIESNGMICAKEELGIKEDMDNHGIWILEEDFDDISDVYKGTPLGDKYPRLNSWFFDVDNKGLTHRPDLTGHFGVATELFSIYNIDNKVSYHKISEYYDNFRNTNILDLLESSQKANKKVVCETDKLNSYLLLELNNVNIKKSNLITRLEMLDMGLEPRNNWVDFSNLFMISSGQPIHFFDADKIEGNIIIRNAKEGEKFIDLFEKEHTLKDTDIVIADEKKILALAGVVGGLDSGVTENTKNVLVEIANFDAVAVRKTGTRLALRTDAELRFEKHINPIYSIYSLILFLDQLGYYAKDLGDYNKGGLSYFVSEDTKDKINSDRVIKIDYKTMSQFIFGEEKEGFADIAKKYLEGIGYQEINEGEYRIPMWRSPDDINIVEDIYEEVSRLYGYDNIPSKQISTTVEYVEYTPTVKLTRKLEDILVRDLSFDQLETYPWIGEKRLKDFSNTGEDLYQLENPLDPDRPYLRDSMKYNLISHLTKNSKFFDEIKIFDIGKIWDKKLDPKGETTKYASSFVGENFNWVC